MRFITCTQSCLLLAFLCCACASAQTPSTAAISKTFAARNGSGWTIHMTPDGSRIESAISMVGRSYGKEPVSAARKFLAENSEAFRLRKDLSDLEVLSNVSTPFSGHVEFQQILSALPVDNARIRVNFNKEGLILEFKSSYAPFQVVSTTPHISKQKAIDFAVSEFLARANGGVTGKSKARASTRTVRIDRASMKLDGVPGVSDIFFAVDNRIRRAYKVLVKATVPFGIREVIIDGENGKVLRSRSLVNYFDDGSGQVFIPNPVNSLNNNALTDANFATQPNTTNNPNPYYTRPLLDLDPPVGGKYKLTGPYVTLEEIEDPKHAPPSEDTTTFVYTRGNSNFDDVMVYYHIDAMERYIQLLGFINVNNRRVRADSDGVPSTDPTCGTPDANGECDQSHYVPSPSGAGYIAYGHGGVDDDEDADIIAHEYGHSIQDNSNPGAYPASDAPGAMGEGFGDYWAVSMFSAETVANGHTLACVGEWDSTFYSPTVPPCLRRVDNLLTMDDYSAAIDVHTNGEIWSKTLFDLFGTLGRTTADRLVLQSHFNVSSTGPSFRDAADAMVTADLQLFYGTHITSLCTEFLARKIYAAGDCPTLPSTTGAQSTLFVLASFNEAGLPTVSVAQATTIANNMSAYLAEGSFGLATLGPPSMRSVNLANARSHYYDEATGNMLIEMVQEVVDLMHAAEPAFDFAAVDSVFVITNDDGTGGESRGEKEWATTGPWPYTLPAGSGNKRFSASIHRFDQSSAQFDHALGHHFGMFDLYPHDGVIFPRPYVDGWSNMAKDSTGNFNDVDFLGWDKQKPGWISGANVTFVPRPPADPDPAHRLDQTFPIFKDETALGNARIIQVGTTPNVTQASNEHVSYYIEARKKSGAYDGNLPGDAVLVYYVNEDIGQGFGPVRLIDAAPGTSNDLNDAGLLPAPATSSLGNIDSTGLTVEVLPKTGAEDYRVHIVYDPPEDQNDVWIHPHDDNWQSPDIWVDGPACNSGVCGFDSDAGRTEVDRGDQPQPNVVNRLYARVFNHGPGIAHNVRVDFYLSEPYHGIDGGDVDPDTGGNVAFNEHYFTVIADLPPTDAGVAVFVPWTPATPPSGSVHTCVKVKIAAVFNDSNGANQASQENINSYDLTSHSPYPPVKDDFKVANPYKHPIFAYIRADDVPVGWTADIVPTKVYLPVGGSVNASMTIHAPLTYPVCSTEFVKATAWYPVGDTLVPLGSSVAQVNLKKSTDLTTHATYSSCERQQTALAVAHIATSGPRCEVLSTQGCTTPPRPFEHITLTYTGPDGNPVYHDVVTDKNGCYQDFVVNPQGGAWSAAAQYPGAVCNARTDGKPQRIDVPVDTRGGSSSQGSGRPWYSIHLGVNAPTGYFSNSYDPGPSLTLDAEYPIRDNFSIDAMLGYHVFDHVPHDLIYRNLSIDAKGYFPIGWARGYIQAGPGVYFPNSGSNAFGINVGFGLSFPITPNFKIEVGPDFHRLNSDEKNRSFIDTKIGIVFRF